MCVCVCPVKAKRHYEVLNMCVCVCPVKAKRHYEKSHRESEKALDAYRKSDADIHLSRADVEKVGGLCHCF